MIEGYIMGTLIGLNFIVGRIFSWNKTDNLRNNLYMATLRAFLLGFTIIVCRYLINGTQTLVASLMIAISVGAFTLMIYALCAINGGDEE